jgi:hypothetical protein
MLWRDDAIGPPRYSSAAALPNADAALPVDVDDGITTDFQIVTAVAGEASPVATLTNTTEMTLTHVPEPKHSLSRHRHRCDRQRAAETQG